MLQAFGSPEIAGVREEVERSSKCLVEAAQGPAAIGDLLADLDLSLFEPADSVSVNRDDRKWLRLRDAIEESLDRRAADRLAVALERAQRFSDRLSARSWPSILNRWARRVNPLMGTLLGKMQYYWVTAQCEYSTDVMFQSTAALKDLYPKLISHSCLCFGAKEVMGFLGKKLAGTFRGEYVSDMTDRSKQRPPGMRVKHRVKVNWVKMYDKAGSVLRVEMVINDPTAFKVRKRVRRRGRRSRAYCIACTCMASRRGSPRQSASSPPRTASRFPDHRLRSAQDRVGAPKAARPTRAARGSRGPRGLPRSADAGDPR